MYRYDCIVCGFSADESEVGENAVCPKCGSQLKIVHLLKQKEESATDEQIATSAEANAEPEISQPSEPQHYKIEFTGTSGEYFRIWIVNLFLTILTVGIYAAWAKVRTRRYFYAHTGIAGHSFEYLANPLAILKGNLIIGGVFLLYSVGGRYNPVIAVVVMIVFALFLPFLIYKTLRFHAHNSAFRNIRFRFFGKLGESYVIFILIPFAVLIPIILMVTAFKLMGLPAMVFSFVPLMIMLSIMCLFPYLFFRMKKYYMDNFAFGATKNAFDGRPGYFYTIYLIVAGIFVAIMAIIGAIAIPFAKNLYSSPSEFSPATFIPLMAVMYILLIVVSVALQQYVHVRIGNYCWEKSELGTIRFLSTLKVGEMIWIHVSNIFAILFSIGLLIPWAKIRKARYVLDHLTVISYGLDDFTSEVAAEDSAIGDVATGFFDMEIGL